MYSKSKKKIKIYEEKIELISNENIRISKKLLKFENEFEKFQYLHTLQTKEKNLIFQEISKKLINLRKKNILLTEENKIFQTANENILQKEKNIPASSPVRSQHFIRTVRLL